ncbi:MAG: response regulator [bacterium]
MAVITIFSGSHCRGEDVSSGVAEALGYSILDDELMRETASRFDLSADKVSRALTGPDPFFNKLTHEREKTVASLRLVLAEQLQANNLIIQGCGGHLIPRTIGHVLRVLLIANQEYRVKQATQSGATSEKEAARLIADDDKLKLACTDYLLGKEPYDESLYDIVIPMHQADPTAAVKTICEFAASEAVQTTERSRAAAADFIMAANVGLELARAGVKADVHAESGAVILSINEYVIRLSKHRENLKSIAEKVPGVTSVSTRLGPGYTSKSLSPWSDVGGPPKVILVDDEKEFVQTLSERLRTRSLDSSIAYDGESALSMLEGDIPDVMVLDLKMPGIDGIEVLRRIKQSHPQVEVIILTGHGSDREREQAEELGAFAYLNKPVDIDQLTRVMKDAYAHAGRKRAEGEPEQPGPSEGE